MSVAGLSQRTVYNYMERLARYGHLDPKPLHRPNRKFTPQVRRSLGQLLAQDPEASSSKLASKLNERIEGTVSSSGVRKTLQKMGNAQVAQQPRQLSTENKRKRLIYAQTNLGIDWKRIWDFDEVHFDLWKGRHVVRFNVHTGHRRNFRPLSKNQESVSLTFAAAINHNCKSDLVELPKNWHVGDWTNIIENELLPSINWDPSKRRCRAWIVDNDGKHHSLEILTMLGLHGLIPNGFLPPNSPDLNPIENVWHIMKQIILQRHAQNERQLRSAVAYAWECITPQILQNLHASLPHRMQQVIDANGDRTNN